MLFAVVVALLAGQGTAPAPAPDDVVRAATAQLDERREPLGLDALRAALAARSVDIAARDDDARAQLYGITPEGLRALGLEADAARAQLVAWPEARLLRARVDVAHGSALAFGALEAVLVFGLAVFAVRRAPGLQRRARLEVAAAVPWPGWRSVLAPLLSVLARVAAEAFAIGAVVFAVDRALSPAPAEVAFVGSVVASAAVARVVVLTVVGVAGSSPVSGAAGLSPPARRGLMRMAGSTAVAVVAVIAAVDGSVALVGDHALASAVFRAGVVAVVAVALWRLRRIDDVIARAAIESLGDGWLKGALSVPRPPLLAVTAGAVVVVVDGAAEALRSVVGRSGSVRRLLAWAFRRRLQQLERAASSTKPLPAAVRAVLGARLSIEERPADQQAALQAVRARIDQLRAGLGGFSAALVGRPGSGRSSALAQLIAAGSDLPLVRARPTRRLCTEADACAFLGGLIGDADADADDDVVARLRALPPRLIVVDDAHRFLLRAPGALDGHKALVDVVGRTSDRHGWLLAFHEPAYFFASAVYGTRNEFQHVVPLLPWSADDTTALLDGRLKKAGLRARFDDLVAGVDVGRADLARTGESFFHLVWDSADGNPRAALSLLAESLVVDEREPGVCRVRPFQHPDAAELESAETVTRLVLAALVLHHAATADELARVLRMPPPVCLSALVYLQSRRVVDVDADGSASVAPAWQIAATRFLAQKNLSFH